VFWPGFTYLLVFFFLFFYPLKLVTGFANVTSFKLKIMTLFSTSTIPLNLFMEIILSLTWHIYCHSYYLFISFIPNIHYSSKRHYFDPMCCFFFFLLLLFLLLFLRGFTYLMQPYYSIVSPTFNRCLAYVIYIKCLDIPYFMFWRYFWMKDAKRSKLEVIDRFDV